MGLSFLIFLLIGILLVSAVIDIRVQKIPNLLTFPTMAVALFYFSVTQGWSGLLFSAEGLALGMLIFIIPYVVGGMGAGDVKLMGAVGAVLGPKGAFLSFIFTAIAGGIYALILLLIHFEYGKEFLKRNFLTLKTFVTTGQLISIPAAENSKVPRLCYGVVIALGTYVYMFLGMKGYELILI